jgi:sugar phosphate isomerase/epimerase
LYWITRAGVDALAFVKEYPGRFMSYHVKDANIELEQTTVGTGIIPFEDIFELNETSGVDFLFVEDERTDDPLKNVENALLYLKSL